jgi:short-subunit dehydrogenase
MSHPNKLSKPLSQKTVVICGASSGIGRAAAIEFAKEGSILILAARRETVLEELAAECIMIGAANAIALAADVTDVEALQHVAIIAESLNGSIDVWINNAGIGAVGEYDKIPMHIHEQVIKTSLIGHMNGTYAVLPIFKSQTFGILINTISVGGWVPEPYAVAYTAAKYGLRGFSESLRCEMRLHKHIKICDIFPAYIDTPGFQHGANYVGKVLKPVPPVFPAKRVAKTMVKLAKRPKNYSYVGETAKVYKKMNQVAPSLTRSANSAMMENYFKRAKDAPITSGAVLNPVAEGTNVSGGWLKPKKKQKANKTLLAALFVTGLAAGIMAVSRRKAK